MDLKLNLVSFKQAKALKELGYPQRAISSIAWYSTNGTLNDSSINAPLDLLENECCAPTLELVKSWLMSKFIFINVIYSNKRFHLEILNDKSMILYKNYNFDLYEDALSVGVNKAIEILKNK